MMLIQNKTIMLSVILHQGQFFVKSDQSNPSGKILVKQLIKQKNTNLNNILSVVEALIWHKNNNLPLLAFSVYS